MSTFSPVHHRYEPGPEIASFYHLNDCDLAGCACSGTACFVAHNSRGEPQPVGSPRVCCLGRCFEAPAIGLSKTRPRMEVHSREAILLKRLAQGGVWTFENYCRAGGYQALDQALTESREAVLATIEDSGLRGRGGAGFPTGLKWRAAAAQPAQPKYIVANADEGDPGAFSDRFLMENDPHALIEGMAIAAYATGATKGWIYLRHEYPAAHTSLDHALAEARDFGVLGGELDFDIEVFVGHGSYICGEESALLLSIEGKRPEITARPPYPTERGLFGQPTVTNNVETFANVPWIIRQGCEAYHVLGCTQSRGTKLVSLNSLFKHPGLYEVEFGFSVRHIVEEIGGGLRTGTLKGVLVGGPLAGIIPPELLNTRFGFEELAAIGASVGHGGVIAFDETTSIASLVRHVFSFGANESCGKCTPCRLGARRIEEIFANAVRTKFDDIEWREIARALKMTSLCGHGTGLGAFAESVLHYYGEEVKSCFT
ncbi:MAG: NADH-ubiquinone oxidoreductase-F iron-sulfur binding region domain-containing protein [Luteolibacter sp.]